MTEKFIRSACRIMYRPILPYQDFFLIPTSYKHIVDSKTYDAINRWQDIGATKTGVWHTPQWIKTALAEITMERIEIAVQSLEFEFACLWMDKEDIKFKYWPRVQLSPYWKTYIRDEWDRGECSQIPLKFLILP